MQTEITNRQSWIDDRAPSLQTRLLIGLMRLFRVKNRKASVSAVKKRLQQLDRRPASHEPEKLGLSVKVTLKHINECPVYYTTPMSTSKTCNYVIFLHGGGYIDEIVAGHWKIIGEITRKAKVQCIVPIYPLAPKTHAEELVPMMGRLVLKIFDEIGAARISIVGNSAGAALGLATSQWLRDQNARHVDKLVLISAGLNASFISTEQRIIAKKDPFLDIAGALYGAKLYAGNMDLSHPYVSPLNGELHTLPPIIAFSGTLDFLYPNSIELKEKVELAGGSVELHLKKGQPHNYPGLPTPEGRAALKTIIKAIS